MEYRQLIRQSNRYPGRPTVLSPQLQDFNILEHVRHPIPVSEKPFMLAIDVSFVKEDEIKIAFPEENILMVNLQHDCRDAGGLLFARDCVYFYELPKNIPKKNLVGLWTADDFLIIQEKKVEKPEGKSEVKKGTRKSISVLTKKISSGKDTSRSGKSGSKDDIRRKPAESKTSADGGQDKPEDSEGASETETFQFVPIKTEKIFKPVLCVKELKFLMSDIEDRLLCARRFIENHSFATPQESKPDNKNEPDKKDSIVRDQDSKQLKKVNK